MEGRRKKEEGKIKKKKKLVSNFNIIHRLSHNQLSTSFNFLAETPYFSLIIHSSGLGTSGKEESCLSCVDGVKVRGNKKIKLNKIK